MTPIESIYKADLSDLCDLKFHAKLENDKYHILIMRIGASKTVKDKHFFCKTLRHQDAQLCSIGILGLYLLGRFHYHDELKKFDFCTTVFG